MLQSMFGAESEYAVAGLNGQKPMSREDLVTRLVFAARRQLTHLPDTSSANGMYLANGARFYVDCGLHPEMTTPECTTPWEVARYIKAGERVLETLIRGLQTHSGLSAEVMCFRCNVDYSGTGSTWGCHESYLYRKSPANLPDQLIPHLVSRVVYTGAGGFHPLVSGLAFCVAPRLMHIQQVVSNDSTGNRGIFHTKNEPLAANGNNRLHILCGESLCSETAIVLKFGATALVSAMTEQGLRPGDGLRLASPLDALHAVSSDVTCRRGLQLVGGGETTAIEMQRRLLHLAERNLAVLPSWADAICALWRRTLDRLEGAPDSVATVLDWAIKYRLFRDRAERLGVPFEWFELLNTVVQRLGVALAATGEKERDLRLSTLLGPGSLIPEEVARSGGMLAAAGRTWEDLDRFLVLRSTFCQIDTRFGQIGPKGIFSDLDARDVLDHKVAGVDGIEAAMNEPPAVGRAKLRGKSIRRLAGQRGAGCNWTLICSPDGCTLDLSDPFATAEAWQSPPASTADENLPPDFAMDAAQHAALDDRIEDVGRFQQMIDAMRGRHGRPRTRAQGSTQTTEGPNR